MDARKKYTRRMALSFIIYHLSFKNRLSFIIYHLSFIICNFAPAIEKLQ